MRDPAPSSPPTSCAGCDPGPGRREFLRRIAAIAAGVAGALQISPRRAAALSVGLSARGEEVTYAIPAQDGVTIDKEHEVILVRHQQAAYAFGMSCPHQKTPLRWQEADSRFQCPKHKSRFQPDGIFVDGRATRGMDRYGISRKGDNLVVDLGKLYKEDENREGWLSAVVRL